MFTVICITTMLFLVSLIIALGCVIYKQMTHHETERSDADRDKNDF